MPPKDFLTIIHRINTLEELADIPSKYGVELDIRGLGDKLFLSHDPLKTCGTYTELGDYLKGFNHKFAVLNIKEAGYEQRVIDLMAKNNIKDYFLLDVEFPFLYSATRKSGFKNIAVRYSEAEPIEAVEAQVKNGAPLLDWVWIDTNTKLPLDSGIVKRLKPFKTCLVCPERWGRSEDIEPYIDKMKSLGFRLDAVMTSKKYAEKWQRMGETK